MEALVKIHKKLRGSSVVVLYFVQEGFLGTCFHSLQYPFFGQYLNLSSHQYTSSRAILSVAWSFKLFFSFFSDAFPIFGYRRIPYMTLGLFTILAALSFICFKPMPQPFYKLSNDGLSRLTNEIPLNPDAPNQVTPYIALFFIWYLGLSCADCSVDALMTQRSKLEPEETRGTLISKTRISYQIGSITALLTVGLLLNKVNYGGSFVSFGLEFNQYMLIPFIITLCGLVYAFIYTNEKDVEPTNEKMELKKKLKDLWRLFHKWNYLKLLIFVLILSIQWAFRSPAGMKVQTRWVEIEPLVANCFAILTCLTSALGMIVYMKYFLNSNWRFILILAISTEFLLELPVISATIFGVIRNQYFWFMDDLFGILIWYWFEFIIELVIVEYALDGIEGICYALTWAIVNIGISIGSSLTNFVFSPFCLTEDSRYVRDSANDRLAVWLSYMICYGIQLLTLLSVFLIPNQKKQAQEWRLKCHKDDESTSWNAVIFVSLLIIGFICAMIMNCLTLFESTRCLMIAGGPGCGLGNETFQDSCILL